MPERSDGHSGPGAGYHRRRDEMLAVLWRLQESSCCELAEVLGWSSREVAGKLTSARRDGNVVYANGLWRIADLPTQQAADGDLRTTWRTANPTTPDERSTR